MDLAIGKWPKGMNNVLPDLELPEDTLRDAVNVDVGDSGRIRLRPGRRKVYEGTICKHTFADNGRGLVLFVEGGDLKKLERQDDGTFLAHTIRAGVGHTPMSYCFVNDQVFFANGIVIGRIVGGDYVPLVIPAPTQNLNLVASSGDLPAGAYQVAATFFNPITREESGAGLAENIGLPEGGGIEITSLPAYPGHDVRLYVTEPNGEVFYRQVRGNAIKTLDRGAKMQTQFLSPMPTGQAVSYYNGRLFVAQGNVIWYSEPWAYGLIDLEENFFQFPADISVMVDVSDPVGGGGGIFVVADRTYFLSGPAKPSAQEVETHPFKGVKYTAIKHPDNTSAAWVCEKGIAIGSPGGQVRLLTEESIAHPDYAAGALLYREFRGRHQFIATLFGGEPSVRAFSPWS